MPMIGTFKTQNQDVFMEMANFAVFYTKNFNKMGEKKCFFLLFWSCEQFLWKVYLYDIMQCTNFVTQK